MIPQGKGIAKRIPYKGTNTPLQGTVSVRSATIRYIQFFVLSHLLIFIEWLIGQYSAIIRTGSATVSLFTYLVFFSNLHVLPTFVQTWSNTILIIHIQKIHIITHIHIIHTILKKTLFIYNLLMGINIIFWRWQWKHYFLICNRYLISRHTI